MYMNRFVYSKVIAVMAVFAISIQSYAVSYRFTASGSTTRTLPGSDAVNQYGRQSAYVNNHYYRVNQATTSTVYTFGYNANTAQPTYAGSGSSDFAIANDDAGNLILGKQSSLGVAYNRFYYSTPNGGTLNFANGYYIAVKEQNGYTLSSTSNRAQAMRAFGNVKSGTGQIYVCPTNIKYIFRINTSGGDGQSTERFATGLGSNNGVGAMAYQYNTNKILLCCDNGLYDCTLSPNGENGTMSKTKISVTSASANYCKGSAMVLFKGHRFLFAPKAQNTVAIWDLDDNNREIASWSHFTIYNGSYPPYFTVNAIKSTDQVDFYVDWRPGDANATGGFAHYTLTAYEVLANPTFSPASGSTFNYGTTNVTITGPSGSTIYYKQNGTQKHGTSPVTVAVSSNTSLTDVYAQKSGYWDSGYVSASYSVRSADVTYSPSSAQTYNNATNITLTSASGGTIYYTLDGTTPTTSSLSVSSGGTVTLNDGASSTGTRQIKAFALSSGYVAGNATTSPTYTFKCATPSFSPSSASNQSTTLYVTATSATTGATIYYTLDGTTPTTSSSYVSNGGSITIPGNGKTLKAIAVKNNYVTSDVATAGTYHFKCALPSLSSSSPQPGTYTTHQQIYIDRNSSLNGQIYYTTDGSDPRTSSTATPQSGSGISLTSSVTIKACERSAVADPSDILTLTYTINATLDAPTFSPATGEQFTTSGSVTITAPSGSTLHYSTDGGSTYTTASSNTATVTITEATTLKAYATQTDKTDSSIAEASYTVKCPTPSISPSTGTYAKAQSVTISCADAGATIYYTTDGSTPTTSSTVYSSAFTISKTTTVKAIAVRNNCVNSDVASETITITPQSQPVAASSINVTYSPVIGTSTNNPDRDLARIDATITFDRPNTSDGTTFPAYPTTFSDYYLDHYVVTVYSGSGYAKTEGGADFLSVSFDAKSGAGAANTVSLKAYDLKVGQQTNVCVTACYVYQPTSATAQSSQTTKSFSGYTYETYSPSISAATYCEPHQAHDVWWERTGESHRYYFDVYRVEITLDDDPLYNPSTSIPVSYYQLQVSKDGGSTWTNVVDRTINNLCYGDTIEAPTTYPIGQGIGAGRFKGNYRFTSNQIPGTGGDISFMYYWAVDVTSAYHPTSVTDPTKENPASWVYRISAVYGGSDSVTVEGTPVTPTTGNVSATGYTDYIPASDNPVITGVDNVKGDVNLKEVQYYDLNGVRLNEAPSTGFYIEVRLYDNGQIATSKRLAR